MVYIHKLSIEKVRRMLRFGLSDKICLTLGKLALLAGTFEAELLAFFFTGIAGKQVGALECAFEVFVHCGQCLGDSKPDGFDLAVVATTGNMGADGKFVLLPKDGEWLVEFTHEVLAASKIFFGRFFIDRNGTLAALQTDTGSRAFAAAEGVEIVVFGHVTSLPLLK
jgi:hypothetical protein